jgi:hypothetical protein
VEQRNIDGELVAAQKVRGFRPRAIDLLEAVRRDVAEHLLAGGSPSGRALLFLGETAGRGCVTTTRTGGGGCGTRPASAPGRVTAAL